MNKLIIAAVAALLASPAGALDLTIRHAPPQLFTPGASARMIDVLEPLSDAARRARAEAVARWEQHCQPAPHRDAYGITRLTYAHPGCEFGEGE